MTDLTTPDGTAEAWLARPADIDATAPVPGVLLFMDAFGLRPRIFEMADRVASWGYVVLAPNVFYRSGTAAEVAPDGPLDSDEARREFFKVASPRISGLTTKRALPDIAAYLEALTSRPDVTTPVGVVGYCMGARLAVRAATAHPDVVAACGAFHGGGLASDAADSPHLGLAAARAEFVFGHADHDASMDAEAVARLEGALRSAGLTATNEIYEGAGHGYTMADTPVYDEAATERHFAALRDLFDRTLR
ncbi:dienelactone hydrolase family protein [Intrasporangium sp.]|uniref:dienelactone hydrolase family protein n=1 Tax=Intrasporangium sp. TaxID=1925024 RepID=UPI00293971A0|nr:dienelactone hydrolase family protein [Intrasporangium sp.]MDV3220254.1 dienelactone hydrolase family protein [Intrasporangium sp.]